MTPNRVSDEQLGQLARKQHDLFRRVREGSLEPDRVLSGLQAIIEGGPMATFDPVAFIGKGWSIRPEDQVLTTAPLKIDPKKVVFKNMFRDGETVLNGEERLRRHQEAKNICLGVENFYWCWTHQDQLPEEWKLTENGEVRYVLFDATVLRRPGGGRHVLCLYWSGGQWYWRCRWLDDGWSAQLQTAVLAG